MCTDPLAQLYLPRGQYVDRIRVADYCTVTVKETNVFHSQASISARGLLATDYAIRANDFSASSYDTRQRAGWGGEEEAQGRAHKWRWDWLQSAERTKKFEETHKWKWNILNWNWGSGREKETGSTFMVFHSRCELVFLWQHSSGWRQQQQLSRRQKKKVVFGVQRHRTCSHAETVGCCFTGVYVEV